MSQKLLLFYVLAVALENTFYSAVKMILKKNCGTVVEQGLKEQ